jgi:probable HAF family extracellular repeat protein
VEVSHSFTLIGGTYTSFDYPGATFTQANAVNSAGEIVGYYNDTSGVSHGFLLSGGTYASIDVPGAASTTSSGINDTGDIVGGYCPTGECISSEEGTQGYLLSGGVFTPIAIPGEFASLAPGSSILGQCKYRFRQGQLLLRFSVSEV